MARKIRRFGKVINDNSEAMALCEEQKALYAEVKKLKAEERNNVATWAQMEGKYSIGTVSSSWGAGHGYRGYDYKYPSQEVRAKEEAERNAYYAENIALLRERINELQKRAWALEEPLCIALWGFGTKEYDLRDKLARAEQELAEQIAYVERLKKELENF